MRDHREMPNHQNLFMSYLGCCLLLFWCASCASPIDEQLSKQFNRSGESTTVSISSEVITNAIVIWSRTLTNGYVLYSDKDTRLYHMALKTDPATLFMLRNGTNAIGFWGKSACLPPKQSAYWADIIIRVTPVSNGSKISVAIHGRHFVQGLAWNFHTFGFYHEKAVDLLPCPQDERQVLDEILLLSK